MSEGDRAVLDDLLREIAAEFPRFQIVKKDESHFARAIDLALKILTLGGQREFMTRYFTVIGDVLYVPVGFDDLDPVGVAITLRHERVHLRQRRRLTLPGMTALYLFLPCPLGLAWFRARLEWEAYTETLRATLELRGEEAVRAPELRTRIVSQFTSAAYGWMWPFRTTVERWYDDALREILAERAPSP
jgi:hypothetical protein